MKRSTHWRTARWIVLGVVAAIAVLAWASASAQPEPPFQVYGDGEPGDTIAIYDPSGTEKGTTTVGADGTWYVQIECQEDTVNLLTFTINDGPATAKIVRRGATLAEVMLTPMSGGDNAMLPEAGDELVEEDELMSEDGTEDAEMMAEDNVMEDESMEEEQMDDTYPDSGSGGLADGGPSTSALVGTLLVLAALVAGAGVWTWRRRA